MPITKEQAQALRYGDNIHFGECVITVGPRGGETSNTETWRVSGQCKTWKTRPDEFRVPIKYGLYKSYYLNHTNAHEWHLASEFSPRRVEKSPRGA